MCAVVCCENPRVAVLFFSWLCRVRRKVKSASVTESVFLSSRVMGSQVRLAVTDTGPEEQIDARPSLARTGKL